MKKLTSLLAAALAIAGCQPAIDDPAQPYRDAMPNKESVQLGTPAKDGTAPPTALFAGSALPKLTADAAVVAEPPPYPDQSEFAVISYWSAVGINGGTWWTLTLVKLVTSFPATTCDDHACTWGPWLGDDGLNNWKLDVNKTNGTFDWVFSAQDAIGQTGPLPRPWVALISGHAIPGVDKDHGKGNFVIDFDAQASLAHGPGWVQRDFGDLTITYDNTGGISVDAVALGGHSADPADAGAIINAAYAFSKSGPGGQIQIAFHNLTSHEAVRLNTRWNAGGAGRGDALWSNDDGTTWVPAEPDLLTQCWDGAVASWAETYDNFSDPTVGTDPATDCVFATGEAPTLALP